MKLNEIRSLSLLPDLHLFLHIAPSGKYNKVTLMPLLRKATEKTNKKQWVSCVFTLSVHLSCLQAEAHGNAAVVKMLRTHTRGPPSRGPVRPLVSLGVGLLHLLLLLSTCLGQDTDGNGAPPSWLSHFSPHTDDPEPAAVCPAGISISDHGNSTFLTGSAAARSPELLMQLSHNTSFLIHYLCTTSLAGCFELDLDRAQRSPLQGLNYYRRSSVFLLERWRSWYLYSNVLTLFNLNGCLLLSPLKNDRYPLQSNPLLYFCCAFEKAKMTKELSLHSFIHSFIHSFSIFFIPPALRFMRYDGAFIYIYTNCKL